MIILYTESQVPSECKGPRPGAPGGMQDPNRQCHAVKSTNGKEHLLLRSEGSDRSKAFGCSSWNLLAQLSLCLWFAWNYFANSRIMMEIISGCFLLFTSVLLQMCVWCMWRVSVTVLTSEVSDRPELDLQTCHLL